MYALPSCQSSSVALHTTQPKAGRLPDQSTVAGKLLGKQADTTSLIKHPAKGAFCFSSHPRTGPTTEFHRSSATVMPCRVVADTMYYFARNNNNTSHPGLYIYLGLYVCECVFFFLFGRNMLLVRM